MVRPGGVSWVARINHAQRASRSGGQVIRRSEVKLSEPNSAQRWHLAPRSDTPLARLTLSNIPQEVADAVERVEGEGERDEGLEAALDEGGEAVDELDEVGRVDGGVDRVEEVDERRGVERAADRHARDTVRGRRNPRQLGTVDGEVGRAGAQQALRVEKLEVLELAELLGRDEAASVSV